MSETTSPEKIPTLRHPEGLDKDEFFFDEDIVRELVLKYQQSHDVDVWKKIVDESVPLIDTLILYGKFTEYDDLDALRSECILKIHKILDKYDPRRGKIYTLFSVSIKNFLVSYAQKIDKRDYMRVWSEEGDILDNFEGSVNMNEGFPDDLKAKVLNVTTRFSQEPYNSVVKYFITFFVNEGFGTPKTYLCNTASSSHNLSVDKCYYLYDYSLIRLRSALIDLYDFTHSDSEIYRFFTRWSFIPEICDLIGPENTDKLLTMFKGVSVTFPSDRELDKIKFSKKVMHELLMKGIDGLESRQMFNELNKDPQTVIDKSFELMSEKAHVNVQLFDEENIWNSESLGSIEGYAFDNQ